MPSAPKMKGDVESIENGVPLDQSMMVETGHPPLEQAADPVIKPSIGKRPWYRRPRILYTIAIVVALISLGLATFAILWATGVVNFGSSAETSAAAGSTSNGGDDGNTPAQEPPVDISIPSPPPQENPGEQEAPPTEPGTAPLPTATPLATEPQRTDPLSFYVMGDVPYAAWEEIMLGRQLADMTSNPAPGAEFLVHVGDMQKAQRTGCSLDHFYKIGNILLNAPLPSFVLVGDNDYLDCPDKAAALANYRNTFVDLEGNWTHSLNVERWKNQELVPMEYEITRMVSNPEMFAFMRDGILFMGFTLLNMDLDDGELPDDLFYERLEDSTAWVTKQLNDKKSQGIRGVVMFSHAMVSPDIRPFFENLRTIFFDAGVYSPVLYIHGDGHDYKINTQFGIKLSWPQLTRIEVDQGAFADPLLITVAPDGGGITMSLTADDSGLQHVLANGLFLLDRQAGRYPDSVKDQYS